MAWLGSFSAKDVKALGKAANEYLVILSTIGASFRDDVAKAPKGEMEVRAEGVAAKLYFDVTDAAAVSRRSRTARRPCASAWNHKCQMPRPLSSRA